MLNSFYTKTEIFCFVLFHLKGDDVKLIINLKEFLQEQNYIQNEKRGPYFEDDITIKETILDDAELK